MVFVTTLIGAVKDWLSKTLPDCRNITPTIGESMDRKLSWWNRIIIELHLFTCDRCGRYLEQLKFLRTTVRSHSEVIADPEPGGAPEYNAESRLRLKALLASAAVSD